MTQNEGKKLAQSQTVAMAEPSKAISWDSKEDVMGQRKCLAYFKYWPELYFTDEITET